MRLRFKSIIEADKLKNSYFKYFKIHLENTDFIDDIKNRLFELEQGNKKVNIVYNNVEVSSGVSIGSDVNLEKILINITGIKNIEKIM